MLYKPFEDGAQPKKISCNMLLKEIGMSQNRYEHLFARIYSHYQQLAQDALRFYPHTFERSDLPQEVSVLDSDPAHDLYGFMQI